MQSALCQDEPAATANGSGVMTMDRIRTRRHWTDKELDLLCSLTAEGTPAAAIAEWLGRTIPAVRSQQSRLRETDDCAYTFPLRCTVPGCTDFHYAKRLCLAHYHRAKRRHMGNNTTQGQNIAPEPAQRVSGGA